MVIEGIEHTASPTSLLRFERAAGCLVDTACTGLTKFGPNHTMWELSLGLRALIARLWCNLAKYVDSHCICIRRSTTATAANKRFYIGLNIIAGIVGLLLYNKKLLKLLNRFN